MHNMYEKQEEPMTDEAKVRFLLKKVQHPGLQSPIEVLKAQQIVGPAIACTMAANHLSTAMPQLPECIAIYKNISTVTTSGIKSGHDSGEGIYNKDGSFRTGIYYQLE